MCEVTIIHQGRVRLVSGNTEYLQVCSYNLFMDVSCSRFWDSCIKKMTSNHDSRLWLLQETFSPDAAIASATVWSAFKTRATCDGRKSTGVENTTIARTCAYSDWHDVGFEKSDKVQPTEKRKEKTRWREKFSGKPIHTYSTNL